MHLSLKKSCTNVVDLLDQCVGGAVLCYLQVTPAPSLGPE